MKSKFFFFAVGALALSACTSEDVLEDVTTGRNVITFENVVNKHSRADLNKDNLSTFYVYGYNVTQGGIYLVDFTNEAVTYDGSAWKYDETNPRYWMPGAKYSFYAYSDNNINIENAKINWVKEDENGNMVPVAQPEEGCELGLVNYISNDKNQSDLIFASQTNINAGETGFNQPVAFTFDHLLTKVQAVFATQFAEDGYKVEITNVVIKDIYGRGNFAPSKGWYAVESTKAANVNLLAATDTIRPKATYDDGNKSGAAYVIPFQYKENTEDTEKQGAVTIEFNVTVTSKDEVVMDNKLCSGTFYPNWKQGYTYTYNIMINGSSTKLDVISFTTSTDGFGGVNNWSTDSNENPTFKF